MDKTQVKIGGTYQHDFGDGRLWNVCVTAFDPRYPDEWVGVLAGEQRGLQNGCVVWGKFSELREM